MAAWLLLTFFICLYEVLNIPLSRIEEYRCLKNVTHQIDGKNESAIFMAKFGLVFVLTLENAFS